MSNRAAEGSYRILDGSLDGASDRLLALLKNAAARIEQLGESAFCEFRVTDSPWRREGVCLFVIDPRGNVLVHPDPHMEGTNQYLLKNAEGRFVVKGLLREALKRLNNAQVENVFQWKEHQCLLPHFETCILHWVRSPSGNHFLVGSGMHDAHQNSHEGADPSSNTQN